MKIDEKLIERNQHELNGNSHVMTSVDTPIREDAFAKSDEEKMANIEKLFGGIMEELGLDLTDDSLRGTPYRVAKMYVKEIFQGLNPKNKPSLSVFENKYQYNKMLVEKDITFSSACEHHFLPITGRAHVAYISSGMVIGLSKINRVVEYYGKRPQVQERMTLQIFNELKHALQTEDVIVVVEAEHLCVSTRGVNDKTSRTTTLEYGGRFNDIDLRNEFYRLI
ncbi:GTP cyclohydrolase I FolE [Ulvibacterium sp.]|uniref:GTP cyclohydrolase I FolE n=1 Tax=Ulvibacterium sp. TaxID=2665914 RepID=UPI002628453E|nr:GTP cyclohydrolase I FolE [Ulvibacterium sp.]